jgi:hypothetical protein
MDGNAGLLSGELYFRGDPAAAEAVLPPGLVQWLTASEPGRAGPARLAVQLDLVRAARRKAAACRAARVTELEAERGVGASLVELSRLAVEVI